MQCALVCIVAFLAAPFCGAQDYERWMFEEPPVDAMGFAPDEFWLENARLGALQLSACVAALVSADGLAVTSASCLRTVLDPATSEDYAVGGFLAAALEEELKLSGLSARQIAGLRDITGLEDADISREPDLDYQVVPREDSTILWEYALADYHDVRLVLLPEAAATEFGAEDGVYPRYSVDFAFVRIYVSEDVPLETESYFAWTERAALLDEVVYQTAIPQVAPMLTAGPAHVYSYNGTVTPPFTTFYGMLDLHHSHGGSGVWTLPARWLSRMSAMDLSSPLNFTVAGPCAQSGAPVFSRDLELLGVAFDDVGETSCVVAAAPGVLTVLRNIYGADHILQELEYQQLSRPNE